jgi:hypothetical protein
LPILSGLVKFFKVVIPYLVLLNKPTPPITSKASTVPLSTPLPISPFLKWLYVFYIPFSPNRLYIPCAVKAPSTPVAIRGCAAENADHPAIVAGAKYPAPTAAVIPNPILLPTSCILRFTALAIFYDSA